MSKKRNYIMLSEKEMDFLQGCIKNPQIGGIRNIATRIGLPCSTFRDLMKRKYGTRKIINLVRIFIQSLEGARSVKSSLGDVTNSLIPNSYENSSIPPERMVILLSSCKGGIDQVVAAMTEIVNGNFPDRKKFRESLGKENDALRTLTRALSSEAQYQEVIRELGRTQLP